MGIFEHYQELEEARERGGIDYDVKIGAQLAMSARTLAARLGGSVRPNGDIVFPGHGGEQSAKVTFNGDGTFSVHDAYGLDWRELESSFREKIGLKRGERITLLNAELLHRIRAQDRARRNAAAADLWRASVPAAGTIVETYLRSRGISLPVPEVLRLCRAWHPRERSHFQAMIGWVTDPVTRLPTGGVHLTALAPDGSGKAFASTDAKWMVGVIKTGIVRLAEPVDGRVAIAEGIETALSFSQLRSVPCWAAMNAGNLDDVKAPPDIRHLIIAADNDKPNDQGVNKGMRAAKWACDRLRHPRRFVEIIAPRIVGSDWNDELERSIRHG